MKHTMQKLLGVLLALTMACGLLPGMMSTAHAEPQCPYGHTNLLDCGNHYYCYDCDEDYEEWEITGGGGHTHDWYYYADGNHVNVRCNSFDGCDYMMNEITLSINAPTNTVCDGSAKAATLSGYPNPAPDGLAAQPSITYNPGGSTAPTQPGDYTASVTWGGKTASVTFTLTAPTVAVTGVSLDQTTLDLTEGGSTATLTATVAPDDASDKTVTWASDNTAVATVDGSGVVTPVGAGTATITVTATNGTNDTSDDKTATCTVTVRAAISATVTFQVVNGSWNDETTADQTVTLTGFEGDALKLTAAQIPAVGGKPNDGYKAGSWNVTPSTDTAITENTTYTYSYAEKDGTAEIIGDKYYIDDELAKGAGLVLFDGGYYYVNKNGEICKNLTGNVSAAKANGLLPAGNYEFGADGKLIIKNGVIDGCYYENGRLMEGAGLLEIDGDYYYVNKYGEICKNVTGYVSAAKANNLLPPGTYEFGDDGKMIE